MLVGFVGAGKNVETFVLFGSCRLVVLLFLIAAFRRRLFVVTSGTLAPLATQHLSHNNIKVDLICRLA